MQQVNDKLWISGQPGDGAMEQARAAGVVRVINNRPDGEEAGQPPVAEAAAQAKALGMDYVHIPVRSGEFTQEAVDAFRKALAETDGPVLAHCRSGTRSLTLYAVGEVQAGRLGMEDLDALGDKVGINMSGAKAYLQNA